MLNKFDIITLYTCLLLCGLGLKKMIVRQKMYKEGKFPIGYTKSGDTSAIN